MLKYGWRALGQAVRGFISDNCFHYSAALSFYTLFSIAPMVMISVHAASLLAAEVDFQQELIRQFSQLVGEQGAQGITVLLSNLQNEESTRFQLILGSAVLLFSATNIFIQLQGAFNVIFEVTTTGRKLFNQLIDRLISLGIILSLGLVMIMSLVIDSAIVLLQNYLIALFPDLTVIIVSIIQYLVLTALAMLEIYALLHFLPDVHLPRSYKIRGCLIITVLLVFGKSAISWYIGISRFSELGGASASVIILMLWVYYSSLIVFFGAELIKGMAAIDGFTPQPRRYAAKVKSVVVEEGDAPAPVQENAIASTAQGILK